MQKNENPKVFISYNWGEQANQERVVKFANQLVKDGVDVVLDKWDLTPGNDVNKFMESCVIDESISHVLILLDKDYSEKANLKKGGVGKETMIISEEVYTRAEQNKFIPVIFSRNDEGEIEKPVFLRSRLHFDLSFEEKYYEEYQKLVKFLYGVPVYIKPDKGEKPDWVTSPNNIVSSKIFGIEKKLESINIQKERINALKSGLDIIINAFAEIAKTKDEENQIKTDNNLLLEYFEESKSIRDDLIRLIELICMDDFFIEEIVSFFESFRNSISTNNESLLDMMKRIFLHEIFIYLILILNKNKLYDKIHHLLNRSYFIKTPAVKIARFRDIFSMSNSQAEEYFGKAIKEIDDINYYTGVGKILLNRIYSKFTKNEYVFIDSLIYNLDVFYNPNPNFDYYWFRNLYIFNCHDSFVELATRLKSKHQILLYKDLFAITDSNELKKKIEAMGKRLLTEEWPYRYQHYYYSALVLTDFIKVNEIGSYE